MAYTTVNKSSSLMNPKIYTGNGGTNNITGVGFAPNLIVTKARDQGESPWWTDTVIGITKYRYSDGAATDQTYTNAVQSINSDGYVLGSENGFNTNNKKQVSWNWKGGTTSIPSGSSTAPTAVSINATAGFGIYGYTGTGSTGRTIAHGLNSAPKMMIVKRLDSSRDWAVYSSSIANTEYLELNNTQAKATANLWGNYTPTSSLIYLGNDGQTNGGSDPYVMYAFADVPGHQKIGSYTGNNSAGGSATQFVYTGFKPRFVMVKETSGTSNWVIYDLNRNYNLTENNFNVRAARLGMNTYLVESSFTDDHGIDILSNGFNIRDNSNDLYTINSINETYTYYAVGQTLVGTNNVPNNAV